MDPILGAAPHLTGAVQSAPRSTRPAPSSLPPQRVRHRFRCRTGNVRVLLRERLDTVCDSRRTVVEPVHREYVAELYSPQASRAVHRQTITCRSNSSPQIARRRANRTWARSQPREHGSPRLTDMSAAASNSAYASRWAVSVAIIRRGDHPDWCGVPKRRSHATLHEHQRAP
jgi:hypothetical protein